VYTIKRGFEEVCEELAKKLESFIPDITSAGIDFVTLDLQNILDSLPKN
jgi:methionine synthase II (cobalamin-independent)